MDSPFYGSMYGTPFYYDATAGTTLRRYYPEKDEAAAMPTQQPPQIYQPPPIPTFPYPQMLSMPLTGLLGMPASPPSGGLLGAPRSVSMQGVNIPNLYAGVKK